MGISKISKIFLLFCLIVAAPNMAQSKIYLYVAGGVNYIPMQSFSHFLHGLPNNKIDKFGFNGEVGLRYNFFNNHNFDLSAEINNNNASFGDGLGGSDWNFRVFPLSIGYSYTFGDKKENKFLTNVGLNLSYNFIQIDEKFYSDVAGYNPNDFYRMYKIGISPFVTLTYKLYDDLSLLGKFKYRFIDDVELISKELNLSGISLSVGLQIKLFNTN